MCNYILVDKGVGDFLVVEDSLLEETLWWGSKVRSNCRIINVGMGEE